MFWPARFGVRVQRRRPVGPDGARRVDLRSCGGSLRFRHDPARCDEGCALAGHSSDRAPITRQPHRSQL